MSVASTASRPLRRAARVLAGAGVSGALVAGIAIAAAPAASAQNPPATFELETTEAELGGTLRITGENWLITNGSAGSVIAVKFDLGAYSRLPEEQVNPNLTVWQIVEAEDDGSFDFDLQIPSGSASGLNGSTPAFPTGEHTIQFLTGSLRQGDQPRSLQSDPITVVDEIEEPEPDKPSDASIELAADELDADESLQFESSGFTPGQGLYTVQVDDGDLFSVPVNGNANGSLSLSSIGLAEYGIGAGDHTLRVLWAADGDVLASADFAVREDDSEEPEPPEEPGDSEGITITADVPDPDQTVGSLTLSIPDADAGIHLGEGENAGDRIVFSGLLPVVTVTDSRSDEAAAGGGWSTSGQVGDFTSDDDSFVGGYLGWTPEVLTEKDGLVAGSAVTGELDGGPGLATSATLASADTEGRHGSADLGAELGLEIPVDTAPGSYQSTLTISLFPTD